VRWYGLLKHGSGGAVVAKRRLTKELEEVVKLLVEREGWENVCVLCCSFSLKW
jgi:hypothetical protein